MKNFAEHIVSRELANKTILVAGIDPRIELIPNAFKSKHSSYKDILIDFYTSSLLKISDYILATKINIAFFEKYGLEGLHAFHYLSYFIKDLNIPLIIDCKRGDIGSTALAYAEAFLSEGSSNKFYADAITINPFLGFDSLEPFIKLAKEYQKGLFILVRTSNKGANDIQSAKDTNLNLTVSQKIALFLKKNADILADKKTSLSGLGAVIGATVPKEAIALRQLMPNNLFLVPGFGSQGADAKMATAGKAEKYSGLLVNASRSIFSSFHSIEISKEEALSLIQEKTIKLKQNLWLSLNRKNNS